VLVGAAAGLLLAGPALAILRESYVLLGVGVAACILAGLSAGAVGGALDLNATYALLYASAWAGVCGAAAGAAAAFAVGLVAGSLCSGRTQAGTFGGAMGALFRLREPGPRRWPDLTTGVFAALLGVFPGTCVGLWSGIVLGALGAAGAGQEGLLVWLAGAVPACALLALVFFGTRLVLSGGGAPRSRRGLVVVALAGAALGAVVAVGAALTGAVVGSPEYWSLGLAAAGALLGAKCWELFGGDPLGPSLLPG
jgi:hypothetical protein